MASIVAQPTHNKATGGIVPLIGGARRYAKISGTGIGGAGEGGDATGGGAGGGSAMSVQNMIVPLPQEIMGYEIEVEAGKNNPAKGGAVGAAGESGGEVRLKFYGDDGKLKRQIIFYGGAGGGTGGARLGGGGAGFGGAPSGTTGGVSFGHLGDPDRIPGPAGGNAETAGANEGTIRFSGSGGGKGGDGVSTFPVDGADNFYPGGTASTDVAGGGGGAASLFGEGGLGGEPNKAVTPLNELYFGSGGGGGGKNSKGADGGKFMLYLQFFSF